MEFINFIWENYSMELLVGLSSVLASPIVGGALAYMLPEPYAKIASFIFIKAGEKIKDMAETKGGFSNEKANTTNTPS